MVVAACIAVAAGVMRGVPGVAGFRDEATVCTAPVSGTPAIQWIDQEDARALVTDANVVFVDARPREDFEAGHVAGALSVPMETGVLPSGAVAMLRSSQTVIAYCDTSGECAGSTRLASLLHQAGLGDVRVLRGGIPAWLDNEFPAEAGPCRICP